MQVSSTRSRFFSHRLLSTQSKSTIAGLLGVAVFGVLIWLFIRAVPFFLIIIALMFMCAVFISLGIRWMPFVSSVLCAISLYFMLIPTPFAFAHFVYPKGTGDHPWLSFGMFVIVAGIVWCMITAIWTGISAGIQNYRQREQQTTPRWFPFALTGMVGLFLGALLIAAIGQPASVIATSSAVTTTSSHAIATSGVDENVLVHMGMTNFGQATVTIQKGQKLELVNDGSYYHSISTGRWVSGQPELQHTAHEPNVSNLVIDGAGKSMEIGPFTTAGVYHLLCTVHPGMTLTIIVR